jgi:hypothetical protein
MPKDPTRNVDRYKVRGGQFDDLDRTKNEGGTTGDAAPTPGGAEETSFIPGESPQEASERKQRLMEEVHSKAEQRRQATGAAAGTSARGGIISNWPKRTTSATKTAAGAGKGGAKKASKKSVKKTSKKAAKKSSKASAGAPKKGARKSSPILLSEAQGRGAAGSAKKGGKSVAGRKAATGGRPSGGAKKSLQKRSGSKAVTKSGGGGGRRPGAG